MTDAIATVVAKQEITEGLYRYCRGLDRMDRDVIATAFHPDATVDFPYYGGSWQGFVDWVWKAHEGFVIHSHQVTNVLIEVDPKEKTAESEAYVTAALWRPEGEATSDVVAPGHSIEGSTHNGRVHQIQARYLDRWSERSGTWAIDYRQCVVDLQALSTTTALVGEGRRDTEDASYRLDGISRLSQMADAS